jgi:hypothetical protein
MAFEALIRAMKSLCLALVITLIATPYFPSQNAQASEKGPSPFAKLKESALARETGKKARNTYLTPLGLVMAKDILSRLSEENLDLNAENISHKVVEVEKRWGILEETSYKGADGLILAFMTQFVDTGVTKVFPYLSEKKFLSKFLNSFVTGLILTVGMDIMNRIVLMASRYLIEHPDLEFFTIPHLTIDFEPGSKGLTTEEIKQISLLQDRVGMTYFTSGLKFGGPVTRSAYSKVYDEYDGGGDDLTGVDIRTLDMSEIHDLVARTTDNLAKFNYEKDRRRKEQQDADLEKSIIAKYEARRKELEPDPGPSRPVFVQPVLPGIEPKKGA